MNHEATAKLILALTHEGSELCLSAAELIAEQAQIISMLKVERTWLKREIDQQTTWRRNVQAHHEEKTQ